MACEQDGFGQQEERYVQALETASRFELVGSHMTLVKDGKSLLNWVNWNGNPAATTTAGITAEIPDTTAAN